MSTASDVNGMCLLAASDPNCICLLKVYAFRMLCLCAASWRVFQHVHHFNCMCLLNEYVFENVTPLYSIAEGCPARSLAQSRTVSAASNENCICPLKVHVLGKVMSLYRILEHFQHVHHVNHAPCIRQATSLHMSSGRLCLQK